MNKTVFEVIQENAEALKLDLSEKELAVFADDHELTPEQLESIKELFNYLAMKKQDKIISTLLRLSRLPDKQPKTFENFDFSHLRGKQVDRLKSLQSLSPVYSHKNLAFIGPQGVGKTHLAMAFGYECCQKGMKTVRGKMILPPHGKEFFHAAVSSFLHPSVRTFFFFF